MSRRFAHTLQSPSWWLRQLGFVLLMLLLVQLIAWWQGSGLRQGTAPPFAADLALPLPGQNTVALDSWRAQHEGRPVVLYFWAEWCPVCKVQQGAISSLMQDAPVLTIASQSGPPQAVQQELLRRKLPWLTAVDSRSSIAAAYGVKGFPTTLILRPDGQIHSASVGYTSDLSLRVKLWLAARSSS